MRTLLDDYLCGEPGLAWAYAAAPSEVADHSIPARVWDPALADAVREYQTQLGHVATCSGDELVIITGQQPGIFTGPLYTIYKAITALKLAAALREQTSMPVLPIYWVGGDDHDFDEIRTAHVLSKQHNAVSLAIEPSPGQQARSVFQLPIPKALHDLADEVARHAPGSEFSEEVRAFLHESLDAADNLADWHARLMARLFRDTPLVIFTPDLEAARGAAIPVFEREIRQPLESTARLNAQGTRLEAAGYGAQVVKSDDACNFFLESRGMRCRVRYVGDEFLLPDTGERFTAEALLELLHQEPSRFTANVALRCIVQQHLFPVRAYVAGPGELAYWGQLKGVFEQFEQPMPVVYPRIRAAILSLKAKKLLGKHGLSLEELYDPLDELQDRALRAGLRDPALEKLAEHRTALEANIQEMLADFSALGRAGANAAALAAPFADQVQGGLEHLERNLLRADRQRTETVRAQIQRLQVELAPDRKPQERYYSLFSWLFLYGWDLVPRLARALKHTNFSLQEVEL